MMSKPILTAAILIVSNTGARDPSTDKTTNILKDVFENEGDGRWTVLENKIVDDAALDIQRAVMEWADRENSVNLIVTSGGTGFATSDITPEVRYYDFRG